MNNANEYSVQEAKMKSISAGFIDMLTSKGLLEDKMIKSESARKANMQRKRIMHHNTLQLLKHYRDINWAIQSVPKELAEELDAPLIEVDALLNLVNSEMDSDHGRMEGRLLSLRKSRLMLDKLHQAVNRLRSKPNNGELMFQILTMSFLQEERLDPQEVFEILGISQRHYYRIRRQAIQLLSILLWSSPDRELDGWLDVLVLLENNQ